MQPTVEHAGNRGQGRTTLATLLLWRNWLRALPKHVQRGCGVRDSETEGTGVDMVAWLASRSSWILVYIGMPFLKRKLPVYPVSFKALRAALTSACHAFNEPALRFPASWRFLLFSFFRHGFATVDASFSLTR